MSPIFEPSDVTVTNADKASSWQSGATATTYVLRLTPTIANGSTGTVAIDVPAGGAMDAATNGNEAATQASVSVDKKTPTVSISGPPSGEQKDPFPLTITFDEDVTDFTVDDLRIQPQTRATATQVTGSGTTYTATITPNADQDGSVTVRVKANAATDEAGNRSQISDPTSAIPIDTMAPTATIDGIPSGTENDAFDLTIDFSEDVTGFAREDLEIFQSTPNLATVTGVTGSGREYTATITPRANKDGNMRVRVKADAVTDAAGNGNARSNQTSLVQIDTIAPTATITAPTMDPQNGAFDVTIDFGESVSGFVVGDLNVVGATKASSWKTNMNGPRRYRITLTPTTAAGSTGTVTIDVDADAARDTGDNPNEAASRVTVDIDKDAPTLTIDAPSDPQNGPFDVTFDFDQDVTGFIPNDVTVTNANKASNWKTSTARRYVLRLTPTATAGEEETVTIDVAANKATDAATNGNEAATQASVMVDKKRPTVSISGLPSGEQKDPFPLTITFNEVVTDFMTDDLIFTPAGRAMATRVTGSGTTYTATIAPNTNQNAFVTVRVRENAAMDAAGNQSTVSLDTSQIDLDTVRPTVVIEDVPDEAQNKGFELIVRFNETVNGFDENDVSLTGPATVTG